MARISETEIIVGIITLPSAQIKRPTWLGPEDGICMLIEGEAGYDLRGRLIKARVEGKNYCLGEIYSPRNGTLIKRWYYSDTTSRQAARTLSRMTSYLYGGSNSVEANRARRVYKVNQERDFVDTFINIGSLRASVGAETSVGGLSITICSYLDAHIALK